MNTRKANKSPDTTKRLKIMAKYNGYANRSQWNQSLWINNDEGLYRLALSCVDYTQNREEAINLFLERVDISHTPDGYKWSKAGIRAAMQGM